MRTLRKSETDMTPSKLKAKIIEHDPETHFFDAKTMKFFGDTMKNYGVYSNGDYWELYRKHPVKHGLKDSAFFDKTTFERVFK